MLNLLISVRLTGGASGSSRPLYVALKPSQGMKTVEASPVALGDGATKSCSYEMVLCSLPVFGSGGKSSFLMLNVYRLADSPGES